MIKKIVVVLLLLLLLLVFWRALYLKPHELPSPSHGKLAENLQVLDIKTKKTVTISQWFGRPFLLHFWASWCDNCYSDMNQFAKYKKIVPIIGVDYKDTPEDANRMMALWGNTFKGLIHDPQGNLGLSLGVVATPETFLIDSHAKILFHYRGPLTRTIFIHEFLPRLKKCKVLD